MCKLCRVRLLNDISDAYYVGNTTIYDLQCIGVGHRQHIFYIILYARPVSYYV